MPLRLWMTGNRAVPRQCEKTNFYSSNSSSHNTVHAENLTPLISREKKNTHTSIESLKKEEIEDKSSVKIQILFRASK